MFRMNWKFALDLTIPMLAGCSLLHLREEAKLLAASGTVAISVAVPENDAQVERALEK